jgi:acyl-CoA thioesterase I
VSALSKFRYVALGDSYTIGTSVGEAERFPNQLVGRLRGVADLTLVANLGVNGYTTDDLIEFELPELERLRPDFVTLLIGVNDVVAGAPVGRYRANLDRIFDAVLGLVPAGRVVAVSTPDYTRTPRGADFGDPAEQRAAIAEFNAVMREVAEQRGVAFVDIGTVADQADSDRALVASDGLHPSGVQYARWVDLIAPVVTEVVGHVG